ncbi:hypothetical protein ACLB1Q_31340 [Escherichia coli]
MPTRCAGVIALSLLRRRILSSISNLTADNDAILWRQNQPFSLAHFTTPY